MSFFALLFFSLPALASAPTIFSSHVEYTVGGQKMAFESIAEEGKTFVHENAGEAGASHIEITPTAAGDGKVELDFNVKFVSKDGKKQLSAKPQMIVKEGELARMDIGSAPGRPPEISIEAVSRKVKK